MEDIEALKDYFKKLQRVINFEASFALFGKSLIQKNKIDDILCCILAKFPEAYKRIMRSSESKKYDSIICYNTLFNAIKNKFFLDSNKYLVDTSKTNKLISTILVTIEKDINNIEKNAH